MAAKRTKQKQYHYSGRRMHRKLSKRKIVCLVQKGILLTVLGTFAMIGMRAAAGREVSSMTVNEGNSYKNAVSSEKKGKEEEPEEPEEPKLQKTESEVSQKKQKTKGEEKLKTECDKIYHNNSQLLVLVNKDKILDENYNAGLTSICYGRLQASERLYSDLVQMLSDAGTAGHHYWIASAYRSRQYQQQLIDGDVNAFMQKGMTYEQALEKTYEETMPAGYSEHETGLALDILCSNNTTMDISQETEMANIWLQEHCYEYGFILRYPKDKESVTKISYEPWHFRYVGREAAKFIKKHDMVLEEFYEMLDN